MLTNGKFPDRMAQSGIDEGRCSAAAPPKDGAAERSALTRALEEIAADVFRRIQHEDKDEFLNDPQAYLAARVAPLVADCEALFAIVRSALEEMPQEEYEALRLRLQGLTLGQIAARLDKAESIVLRDVARAYARVRLRLFPEVQVRPIATDHPEPGAR